jgi:hypothetical protein
MSKKYEPAPDNSNQQPNIGTHVLMERELSEEIFRTLCNCTTVLRACLLSVTEDYAKQAINDYTLPKIEKVTLTLLEVNKKNQVNAVPGWMFKSESN